MTTDFRALCAELLTWAERTSAHYVVPPHVILRARAALSASEQGPTDLSPVQETAPERIWLHLNGANEWLPFKDEDGVVWSPDQVDESDIPYVRADLARWGRPAVEPVPEEGEWW